jgi:hypothetical protein
LKYCATSQKVAVSIPYDMADIILPASLWPLGTTQLLTEMNNRNIFWGIKAGDV